MMDNKNQTLPNRNGGRPKVAPENKRNKLVKVYFDVAWFNKLHKVCKVFGMSLSTYIYDLTVNGKVFAPISKEQAAILRQVAGMANNINQLAHEAHILGYDAVAKENKELKDKIDSLLIKLSEL